MDPTANGICIYPISDYEELLAFEKEQLEDGVSPIHILPRRLVFTAVRRGGLAFRIELNRQQLMSGVAIPGRYHNQQVGWLYLHKLCSESRSHARAVADCLILELKKAGLSCLLIPVNRADKLSVSFWQAAGALEAESMGRWFIHSLDQDEEDVTLLFQLN